MDIHVEGICGSLRLQNKANPGLSPFEIIDIVKVQNRDLLVTPHVFK
jgi:hypothetical protein